MPNKCVKDEDTRILLDRREEIRAQINKLEAEYKAIGNMIMKVYNYEHQSKIEKDER